MAQRSCSLPTELIEGGCREREDETTLFRSPTEQNLLIALPIFISRQPWFTLGFGNLLPCFPIRPQSLSK